MKYNLHISFSRSLNFCWQVSLTKQACVTNELILFKNQFTSVLWFYHRISGGSLPRSDMTLLPNGFFGGGVFFLLLTAEVPAGNRNWDTRQWSSPMVCGGGGAGWKCWALLNAIATSPLHSKAQLSLLLFSSQRLVTLVPSLFHAYFSSIPFGIPIPLFNT